jgi:osmoprotectant transport system ATP-binding protein
VVNLPAREGPATINDSEPAPAAEARGDRAAVLAFHAATKVYPGRQTPAVSDLTLEIAAGEICVLIGPSGSGKTTAMKLVNRLIPLTSGDVTIDGRSIGSLDETDLRRGIGYVFQQIGLFPHMTVERNIGTVPRLEGWPKPRIRERARELLDLVGLDPDEDLERYPGEFSGGQQQRIGVARAMAADQPLMLMDEPFGAVDPIARDRLQDDFLRLHAELPKTVVFVTHDIDEAIKMGNRIAILRDGELVQYDTPDRILATPANDFVADFVGADRGLKRLVVWRLRDLPLERDAAGDASAPSAPEGTTLRDALSLLLTEGAERLTVVDGDGRALGTVALETITGLIGPHERAVGA